MLKGNVGKMCFSRLFEGDDLAETIKKKVEESEVKAGIFILIGSLKHVTLGYYEKKEYKYVKLDGPLEIASCIGNIAVDEKDKVMIHAHVVVSNAKGEAFGGHVMKDSPVGALAELVIIEGIGVNLQRALDDKTGLKPWKLG